MRVPEGAGSGKATVTLSFPAWKDGNVAPATFEVPIEEPKADGKAAVAPDKAKRARIATPPVGGDTSPKAVAVAEARGAATAEADIRARKPVILYYGRPWSAGKPLIDDATGLPVEIVAGCAVSRAFVAEVEGYNRVVRAWHARRKGPNGP